VAHNRTFWMINKFPALMAEYRPEYMANYRPQYMIKHHTEWMIKNRPDLIDDHRPDWMTQNRPDMMMTFNQKEVLEDIMILLVDCQVNNTWAVDTSPSCS